MYTVQKIKMPFNERSSVQQENSPILRIPTRHTPRPVPIMAMWGWVEEQIFVGPPRVFSRRTERKHLMNR